MAVTPLPPIKTLRKLLHCDPESGKLYWKPRGRDFIPDARIRKSWNTQYAGKEAGHMLLDRLRIKLLDETYYVHRVIWKMVHGREPPQILDHINGNPLDNRIENLRVATRAQNNQNCSKRPRAISTYFGVSKNGRRWRARYNVNGQTVTIGNYKTEIEAAKAYDRAIKAAGTRHRLNFSSSDG